MASIYDPAVTTLFATGKAEIVTHRDRTQIVIACMIKVKSQRNRMRKQIGGLRTSKMKITIHQLSDHKDKVIFELIYSVRI